AGTTALGVIGHQHEIEGRPVPAGQDEDRRLTPPVLEREELFDRRAVLHLDQTSRLVSDADTEMRREVSAADPEGHRLGAERLDIVTRPTEDRLHERFGDTALRIVEIHGSLLQARFEQNRGHASDPRLYWRCDASTGGLDVPLAPAVARP